MAPPLNFATRPAELSCRMRPARTYLGGLASNGSLLHFDTSKHKQTKEKEFFAPARLGWNAPLHLANPLYQRGSGLGCSGEPFFIIAFFYFPSLGCIKILECRHQATHTPCRELLPNDERERLASFSGAAAAQDPGPDRAKRADH